MTVRELLGSAAFEVWRHKLRSALTGFSLTIGVAAVLYTMVMVGGMQERSRRAIGLAGPGRLDISPKQGYQRRGLSPGLTYEDSQAIRRHWPELHMVYPVARRWGTRFAYGAFKADNFMAVGVTPEWRRRDWVYTLRGRFLNDEDLRSGARVCVLIQPGGWVKKPFWARYFPVQPVEKVLKHQDLLGSQVRLEDRLFTVVGILREPAKDKDPRWFRRGFGQGGTALVPITAFRKTLARAGRGNELNELQVDTGDEATAGLYLRRVKALLLFRHRGEADFEVRDFRQLIRGALERVRQFSVAVLVIGVVAILAGGIGIMNVTLATMFSRIREIGIRRALGATRADIVWQFVSEAMLLGFCGGLAGTALGILATVYMAPDNERMGSAGAVHVAAGLLVAVGTGFVFSIYPAYQASRLDPVDALRYE